MVACVMLFCLYYFSFRNAMLLSNKYVWNKFRPLKVYFSKKNIAKLNKYGLRYLKILLNQCFVLNNQTDIMISVPADGCPVSPAWPPQI